MKRDGQDGHDGDVRVSVSSCWIVGVKLGNGVVVNLFDIVSVSSCWIVGVKPRAAGGGENRNSAFQYPLAGSWG